MLAPAVCAVLLAASVTVPSASVPVKLAQDFPKAQLLMAAGDTSARMAIGLDLPAEGNLVDTARAFLNRYAATFGLMAEDQLELISGDGVVVFERRRAGVPVQNAEVKVTFDDRGHLTMVHVGASVPATHGRFLVDLAHAEQVGAAGIVDATVLEAKAIWLNAGDVLRPVYLVRVVQQTPYDVLRALVDAESGRLMGRQTERLSALQGSVYDVSPAKPLTGSCPSMTTCAPVVMHTLGGLSTGAQQLNGPRVEARNCLGGGASSSCAPQATPNGSGDFIETPDFGTNNSDRFGEVMTYYQVDRFSSWLHGLDLKPDAGGLTLGFVDALTNIPTEQEYFLGSGPFGHYAIELGQGAMIDWAYDSDIVFHELGHGVVQDTANFGFYGKDAYGIAGEGGALNEGSADCMSIGFSDDALLGDFIGPALQAEGLILTPFVRKLDALYTCQGQNLADGGNPGRFGEIHDDGRILGSLFWAVHDAARSLPTNATETAFVRALASVNGSASFHDVSLALQQTMASKYGQPAADLVACLECTHDLPGCDSHTRKIYAGETHEARLLGSDLTGPMSNGEMPLTFQYELAVPANQVVTIDRFAITEGALPKLYARFDTRVTWNGGSPQADVTVTAAGQTLPAQSAAGTWYIQGAAVDPGNCGFSECTRRFGIRAQVSGGATRPASPAQSCTLGSGVGTCACAPSCTGKACGSDGCSGSCGTCGANQTCDGTGQCVCQPQCAGKACGPDGCGGSCGTCASGTCGGSGTCVGCTPTCSGKLCGSNGCGGSCGQCTVGLACDLNTGDCVDAGMGVCTPMCTGRVCGPNGCGQSCGQCGADEICSVGTGQCLDAGLGGGSAATDGGTGGGAAGGGDDGVHGGSCGCTSAESSVAFLLALGLAFRRRRSA